MLAYLDHLEAEGELDLEAATEFLVLIAALLELKSRLMLPGEELPDDLDALAPAEAAEELLERLLLYARFRGAGGWMGAAHAAGQAYLHRSAPLPAGLRRVSVEIAERAYDPDVLGAAIGSLLRTRRRSTCATSPCRACRSPSGWRSCARCCARGRFSFDEAVEGADRVTVAVTLFALLELYKQRRGGLGADRAVRADHGARMSGARRARSRRCSSSRPSRARWRSWPTRSRPARRPSAPRSRSSRGALEGRGVVLREVAGGWALASAPDAEEAARRLLARPRTSALTPARPRRWRSSPTCSPSHGPRSPASAAWPPSRRPPRSSSAG